MPCVHVREFLSQQGVAFTEKDVSRDDAARDELIGMGFRSTPVTVIGGVAVVGFAPTRLGELLDL